MFETKQTQEIMEPMTLTLAILVALSEILPLMGFTEANGVLHGMKRCFMHIHADSECNVDVGVDKGDLPAHPTPIPERGDGKGATAI
jgi:hypothetical protein